MKKVSLRPLIACAAASLAFFSTALNADTAAPSAIDRYALVSRHNPVVRSVNPDAPLIVGNGNFAFGCDITGLQTLAAYYQQQGVPAETLSRWCWVSEPNTNNYTLADASKDFTLADGRVLPFPTKQSSPAGDWLRKNPRCHPLGEIALVYIRPDGSTAELTPEDIVDPVQSLDLWRGVITSRFVLDGVPVQVETACAADADTVAVRIVSPHVAAGKLRVRIAFPRGDNLRVKHTPNLDWSQPETHSSKLEGRGSGLIKRQVFDTVYYVSTNLGFASAPADQPHTFFIESPSGNVAPREALEQAFTITFSPTEPTAPARTANDVFLGSATHWAKFWRESAAVDFTDSTNPLAQKVEERIVLSRYLMAVQMVGDVPPQESGLTCNTWYGKHHTEMIWWHAAHFALWGNDDLLARNLAWYQSQLPAARELAAFRGLKGARWAKMTGPAMRESPGGNPLIVWNQPHMVYLSELLYRNAAARSPEAARATLQKYRELVLETADCMASMLYFDTKRANGRGEYVLGPPLWIAQEIYSQATSQNPSFELAYWYWALSKAQQWRERLGMPRDEKWDHILAHLSPLPEKDGKYVGLESTPDTWDNVNSRHDHPEMLMPFGFLPESKVVDRATMNRTLDAVLAHWDWETKIWGWDYPMIAMTATRLGRPADALDILMRDGPNNRYLPTGHCPQRSDEAMPKNPPPGARKRELATYYPANGAFLATVALMVAGWDGNETTDGPPPGFPNDGTWKIRAEGLHRSP